MPVNSTTQMTLDFTPGLTERHDSLLDCIRVCVFSSAKLRKTIAADADMTSSELSRKLADNTEDPRKLSVTDFENLLAATGDMTPIYYLIEKFLQDPTVKQRYAMAALTNALPDLLALFKAAQGVA